ncbi:hypothetical protein BHM03_00010085 [Ensete ventricosum]|nr:hypothetical protein BHM03_00010085 [Ensete ventricosum]
MRLNRVESFYAFSQRRKPLQGAAGHGHSQPPCRGDRLQPRTPCKGAVDCDKAPCKGAVDCDKAPCKGAPARGHAAGVVANGLQTATRGQSTRGDRLRVRRPQEGSLQAEAPPARATASSGSACRGGAHGGADRRGGRPLAEWLPAGKGSRRLCRGSSGDDVVRVKEGVTFLKR